jgi:hypothetical protein
LAFLDNKDVILMLPLTVILALFCYSDPAKGGADESQNLPFNFFKTDPESSSG